MAGYFEVLWIREKKGLHYAKSLYKNLFRYRVMTICLVAISFPSITNEYW